MRTAILVIVAVVLLAVVVKVYRRGIAIWPASKLSHPPASSTDNGIAAGGDQAIYYSGATGVQGRPTLSNPVIHRDMLSTDLTSLWVQGRNSPERRPVTPTSQSLLYRDTTPPDKRGLYRGQLGWEYVNSPVSSTVAFGPIGRETAPREGALWGDPEEVVAVWYNSDVFESEQEVMSRFVLKFFVGATTEDEYQRLMAGDYGRDTCLKIIPFDQIDHPPYTDPLTGKSAPLPPWEPRKILRSTRGLGLIDLYPVDVRRWDDGRTVLLYETDKLKPGWYEVFADWRFYNSRYYVRLR